VVEALGAGKRPPVRITINGYTYRSTIATVDGRFMVGINADVREAAGVAAHDKVNVELELDNEPRKITMPPDFKNVMRAPSPNSRVFRTASSRATCIRSSTPRRLKPASDALLLRSATCKAPSELPRYVNSR
jgi:hypothetical protein